MTPARDLHEGLEVLQGKWRLRIIRELYVKPRRFHELRDALGGTAGKSLSKGLRDLQRRGILERQTGDAPFTVEYRLTDKGREYWDAWAHVERWSLRHGRAT